MPPAYGSVRIEEQDFELRPDGGHASQQALAQDAADGDPEANQGEAPDTVDQPMPACDCVCAQGRAPSLASREGVVKRSCRTGGASEDRATQVAREIDGRGGGRNLGGRERRHGDRKPRVPIASQGQATPTIREHSPCGPVSTHGGRFGKNVPRKYPLQARERSQSARSPGATWFHSSRQSTIDEHRRVFGPAVQPTVPLSTINLRRQRRIPRQDQDLER